MDEFLKNEITTLVDMAKTVFVASIDGTSHPNIKAMLSLEHRGLTTHYFSTNYSSKRAKQFMVNPNASIYYCNEPEFKGLMLIGEMEVCTDRDHKTLLWREGFEMYYPKGIDDEDYCVLKFTARKGNYYKGLTNITFNVEEF